MHNSPRPSIAIVGAGPRGTSLLERIGASLAAANVDSGSATNDTADLQLDLHIIDDAPAGAGRIWRTDQTRELCMNTLADAVTLFTEPGSSVAGPVIEGPTLYEWGILALAGDALATSPDTSKIPAARLTGFAQHPVRPGFVDDYREELAAMRPESHPSRAFYGEYLLWCFERAVAQLPEQVRVIRHDARVTSIVRTVSEDGTDSERAGLSDQSNEPLSERLALTDGTVVTADAVILATGWMPSAQTLSEREIEARLHERTAGEQQASDLIWVRPESPIEQDLSAIQPGSPVIMRGLGMSFFDTLTLLTLGRGGSFEPDADTPGGLRYLSSGNEPVVYATSRRGVPFRAKSLYGGLPPRATQRFLNAIDWSAEPRPINFDRRLWPRIVGDAFFDHALTLARVNPAAMNLTLASVGHDTNDHPASVTTDASDPAASTELPALRCAIEQVIAALDPARDHATHLGTAVPRTLRTTAAEGTPSQQLRDAVSSIATAVAPFIPNAADRFDLAGEIDLATGQFASPADFDAWVQARVAADLRAAELGLDSPVKRGLWSISAARAAASRIGTLGGFDAESRASGFNLLFAVGGMVGSGPPAFRNRELLALSAAGLVHFIGPAATLDVTAAGFASSSPQVTGSGVTAPALVDAWMHFHSLDASADPVALELLETGRTRSFRAPARDEGPGSPTGGFDVDPATGRLVQADGTLDPAIHVAGIPADQKLHDTVISPMPGTDPPMLRETDRVARSAIQIALAAHPALVPQHATKSEGALRV